MTPLKPVEPGPRMALGVSFFVLFTLVWAAFTLGGYVSKTFLADHYDTFDKTEQPSERTLCGHIDLSPRGIKGWWGPYGTAGAVQNKVVDANMAAAMKISAAMGHACGLNFKAKEHLEKYKEHDWQKCINRSSAGKSEIAAHHGKNGIRHHFERGLD